MDKTYILQEIRRTAEANGGEALGRKRFESETGIKQYEWYGKFWARWNDAIREAGFAPNQLQKAYDKVDLLAKYAELAKELGRLPSGGDLRLECRADHEFPTHTTFPNRFGAKLDLVQQLAEFCRTRKGYEAVLHYCEQYPAGGACVSNSTAPEPEKMAVVYLIRAGRYYKIGRSNAAGRREYELAIQLPEKPKTIHVIRTDDPTGIEAYWHKRFAEKRKNGEWFELDASDVVAFKRRKFM
jgi:hypothetical protein